MTKHDHVVARFNGADLTFKIHRTDGAQAAAMAVGRAMHGESGASVYETRPLLVL